MNELKLARITEWQGEQLWQRAKLEGMVAENKQRELQGESLAYAGIAFTQLQDEIARSNNYWSTAVRDC